jgi:hypothetical protein
MVAAHAILCVIDSNPSAQKEAENRAIVRCRAAAAFLSDIPFGLESLGDETLRPKHDSLSSKEDLTEAYRGIIMDRMFRGDAFSNSLLNHLLRLKADPSDLFISVASRGSYDMLCRRSSEFPPLERGGFDGAIQNAVESARAWASLDAYSTVLSIATRGQGDSILQAIQGGVAVKQDGTVVPTYKLGVTYASISKSIEIPLLEEDKSADSYVEAHSGSVVSLIGLTAFPCVCEVPSSCAPLFSEAGAKVVSQGITWQSLYLVILGSNLVLAEPERKYVHLYSLFLLVICFFLTIHC